MLPLAYYVENLNPIIFSLGPIQPRWYGMAYLMGFFVAYLLIRKLSHDGMLRLHPDKVPDLVLNCCIFGVLLGGRLGFVLFYDLPISLNHHLTPLLWQFSAKFPYWGVLDVMHGGMSAHGGILFTIITLYIFARRNRVSFVNIGDAACMVVPVGLCFGRIANFVNGELYGHPSTVPWAVKFPSEIYAPTNGQMDPAVHAKLPQVFQQLFASFAPPQYWRTPEGFQDGLNMLTQKLQAHSHRAVEAVAKIIPPRHPSQLYEALLEGVLLFIIVWTIGRLWRKDGMASGAFVTFYPIMRIIGEQFRIGDTPARIFGYEISKGVMYSLIMLLPAIIYWVYWIKRNRRIPWVPATHPPQPAECV